MADGFNMLQGMNNINRQAQEHLESEESSAQESARYQSNQQPNPPPASEYKQPPARADVWDSYIKQATDTNELLKTQLLEKKEILKRGQKTTKQDYTLRNLVAK